MYCLKTAMYFRQKDVYYHKRMLQKINLHVCSHTESNIEEARNPYTSPVFQQKSHVFTQSAMHFSKKIVFSHKKAL